MAKRSKSARPEDAGPESILPLTDFRGDPWGIGNENAVAFRAGILSSPVPAEFARRMRDEGKAEKAGIVGITDDAPAALLAADTASDQSQD
ncbi:hypothetical protein HNR59_001221 [Aquamicrobium lusatiense]|uniref:Uncharacterized protein n=1 Tax=Aquamicrobium lusatiense TaxID=89772 RepID=A0A7W9S0I7_9HYPH|nr:hypothetical protein [Aquamicrobium lusatiense]MBB6011876.1 hypothetical protein [Aquamicrobium lusatiense]